MTGRRILLPGGSPRPRVPGRPRAAPALPLVFLGVAFLALPLLTGCGPDPVAILKAHRIQADPSRTLGQIMESCPFFSKVLWTSYYVPDGGVRVRTSGMVDLDGLVRKTAGTRVFAAKERAVLEKAGAALWFSMEFALAKGSRDPVPVRTAMRIVAMGWEQDAVLTDGAIMKEVVAGKAGDALMKAVLDAADYCRERPPSLPGRN